MLKFCAPLVLLLCPIAFGLDQRALDKARRMGEREAKEYQQLRASGTTVRAEEGKHLRRRRLVADEDDALSRLYGAYDDGSGPAVSVSGADVYYALDLIWISVAALFCFFLQAGFALLEAGALRSKNAKNIMLKNLLDACVGGFVYYLVGYAISCA